MEAYQCERKSERRPGLFWGLGVQLLVYGLLLFSTPRLLSAALFYVPAADVAGLIAAINAANANGEENTINLEPGIYTLVAYRAKPDANVLPVITGSVRIKPSADDPPTVIERVRGGPSEPIFAFLRSLSVGN